MSVDDDPGGATDLVTVRILGLPLQLHARAQQQGEGMRREFALIVEQSREHADAVPSRLLQLSTMLSQRYEGFSIAQEELIQDRIEAGDLQLDELLFTLPAHAGEAAAQLGTVLEEADEFCRQGQLLTLATPPELVAYRQWYLDNFVTQCAGGDPIPWSGPLV
ncbi:MAG: hypothetical protein JWN88_3180 [Frankiales bacterium]|jgi:hypothetical protein|nr:hypothetical protein [Frankiales bacterium]